MFQEVQDYLIQHYANTFTDAKVKEYEGEAESEDVPWTPANKNILVELSTIDNSVMSPANTILTHSINVNVYVMAQTAKPLEFLESVLESVDGVNLNIDNEYWTISPQNTSIAAYYKKMRVYKIELILK